eukprot:GHRR01002260.1.p1 GENE.GHRR01002260.1~~GHRR01002260.1.p1  ORF type:complete len:592 (+),score=307.32 GHRR01002260.1:552-2327(+)
MVAHNARALCLLQVSAFIVLAREQANQEQQLRSQQRPAVCGDVLKGATPGSLHVVPMLPDAAVVQSQLQQQTLNGAYLGLQQDATVASLDSLISSQQLQQAVHVPQVTMLYGNCLSRMQQQSSAALLPGGASFVPSSTGTTSTISGVSCLATGDNTGNSSSANNSTLISSSSGFSLMYGNAANGQQLLLSQLANGAKSAYNSAASLSRAASADATNLLRLNSMQQQQLQLLAASQGFTMTGQNLNPGMLSNPNNGTMQSAASASLATSQLQLLLQQQEQLQQHKQQQQQQLQQEVLQRQLHEVSLPSRQASAQLPTATPTAASTKSSSIAMAAARSMSIALSDADIFVDDILQGLQGYGTAAGTGTPLQLYQRQQQQQQQLQAQLQSQCTQLGSSNTAAVISPFLAAQQVTSAAPAGATVSKISPFAAEAQQQQPMQRAATGSSIVSPFSAASLQQPQPSLTAVISTGLNSLVTAQRQLSAAAALGATGGVMLANPLHASNHAMNSHSGSMVRSNSGSSSQLTMVTAAHAYSAGVSSTIGNGRSPSILSRTSNILAAAAGDILLSIDSPTLSDNSNSGNVQSIDQHRTALW